jgi:NAD(P)H-nitrite reductase large subunit
LIVGKSATAIDRTTRRVILANGSTVVYDKLLLATGSKTLAPPIDGLGLPNVRAFRDIADGSDDRRGEEQQACCGHWRRLAWP